ncbi:CaiB/BaiF CoA transferase family protein [Cupriavidus metallidurans]|uniref:CaiB/BaiF CoA transferase family protein n=1 Tax=Cupriavidus metallidurans TaxID=119219 RepID=UPI001CCFB21A|nr:CoA transferase [Cupriavidus metallidurans]UBM08482.1 CoA transferase [Cupriavidus metallidurans]
MMRGDECADAALTGVTVLDLGGAFGNYCAKLFADLGADVILVEPVGGTPSRAMAPHLAGRTDKDSSLYFQYNNTNKRSIALDLDTEAGAQVFRQLVASANLVVESGAPGVMAARGLGYAALREINPGIVVTSITPFGQAGPYADWKGEDIVGMALGGMMSLGGYFDSEPIVPFGYQGIAAANLFAAVASMAAIYEAEVSGEGQHVDVSMQECVVMGMENAVQFFDLEGTVRKRSGGQQREAGSGVFRCKDGYIYLMAAGVGANRFWGHTVAWLAEEGIEGVEALRDARWDDRDYLSTEEAKATFARVFTDFALRHTKAELYERGQALRIPIAPVCTTGDILVSPQLRERAFFVSVTPDAFPGAGLASWGLFPGAPYKHSETPWALTRLAPALGQHTGEILSSLGIDPAAQQTLIQSGVVQ